MLYQKTMYTLLALHLGCYYHARVEFCYTASGFCVPGILVREKHFALFGYVYVSVSFPDTVH